MAGGVVAVLALGVIYGNRVYTAIVDLWHGYTAEPIERVHVELLSAWLLSRAKAAGAGPEEEVQWVLVPQSWLEGRVPARP